MVTNEERRIKNMEVIKNNRAEDFPMYQGICATGFDMCQ